MYLKMFTTKAESTFKISPFLEILLIHLISALNHYRVGICHNHVTVPSSAVQTIKKRTCYEFIDLNAGQCRTFQYRLVNDR